MNNCWNCKHELMPFNRYPCNECKGRTRKRIGKLRIRNNFSEWEKK